MNEICNLGECRLNLECTKRGKIPLSKGHIIFYTIFFIHYKFLIVDSNQLHNVSINFIFLGDTWQIHPFKSMKFVIEYSKTKFEERTSKKSLEKESFLCLSKSIGSQ